MTDPQPRVVHLRTHRPYIAPETLGRLNGDDAAIAAIKARLDGPARHVTLPDKPTFGERLVDYFRWHGDLLTGIVIGIGLGCLLTAALALLIGGGR